jgi:hypothetical protein
MNAIDIAIIAIIFIKFWTYEQNKGGKNDK